MKAYKKILILLDPHCCRFRTCRHWEGNVCLTAGAEAGTVTNVSYWKAMDGGECVSTGIHRDTLVLNGPAAASGGATTGATASAISVFAGTADERKWRVQSRVISHTWTKAAGHVLASLAAN